jgi:hypothetical protein
VIVRLMPRFSNHRAMAVPLIRGMGVSPMSSSHGALIRGMGRLAHVLWCHDPLVTVHFFDE